MAANVSVRKIDSSIEIMGGCKSFTEISILTLKEHMTAAFLEIKIPLLKESP